MIVVVAIAEAVTSQPVVIIAQDVMLVVLVTDVIEDIMALVVILVVVRVCSLHSFELVSSSVAAAELACGATEAGILTISVGARIMCRINTLIQGGSVNCT